MDGQTLVIYIVDVLFKISENFRLPIEWMFSQRESGKFRLPIEWMFSQRESGQCAVCYTSAQSFIKKRFLIRWLNNFEDSSEF